MVFIALISPLKCSQHNCRNKVDLSGHFWPRWAAWFIILSGASADAMVIRWVKTQQPGFHFLLLLIHPVDSSPFSSDGQCSRVSRCKRNENELYGFVWNQFMWAELRHLLCEISSILPRSSSISTFCHRFRWDMQGTQDRRNGWKKSSSLRT